MDMEQIIQNKVSFSGHIHEGWNRTYCEFCGDGSRTQGPRGGFLFSDDGIFYNCFNCGADGSYVPDREYPFSKKMISILKSFGIDNKDILPFLHKNNKNKPKDKPRKKVSFDYLEVPKYFYKLSEASEYDVLGNNVKKFLREKYKIDHRKYPFYISFDCGDLKDNDLLNYKNTVNRVIIPAFFNNKMIYYQARRIDGESTKKYLPPIGVVKSNIIFNYDKAMLNTTAPLFVTEGFFDAFHLNGVSVMENELSKQQIELLQNSKRPKVVVPDIGGTSNKLALQAINLGWGVSIPEFLKKDVDVSRAVVKYGRLYVVKKIISEIKYNSDALITLNIRGLNR